jgi:hypothetical protein
MGLNDFLRTNNENDEMQLHYATPVGVGDGVRAFNLWDKSHSYVI